jgi:ABC-type sugar transport system ATPase subunit
VDVGAKAAIHAVVENAARRGAGVLVASTELEELLALCDQIIVMVGGRADGIYETTDLDLAALTSRVMRVGHQFGSDGGHDNIDNTTREH